MAFTAAGPRRLDADVLWGHTDADAELAIRLMGAPRPGLGDFVL